MSASRDEKTGKWTAQCYYENWKGEKKHKKKHGNQEEGQGFSRRGGEAYKINGKKAKKFASHSVFVV